MMLLVRLFLAYGLIAPSLLLLSLVDWNMADDRIIFPTVCVLSMALFFATWYGAKRLKTRVLIYGGIAGWTSLVLLYLWLWMKYVP
ncbi:MAG: hypothetical protein PHE83_17170 [Opitutaceae bacterium]|nr:hypothetical protein [Opitutaceae bacterium]